MPHKPVDTAIKVILGPLIDDTDFKSREESIAYNAGGMEITVILEKADGTVSSTDVTPTTGGNYDWAHTNQGYYEFELPASGGASYNNDTEGILTVVGFCTGVLPFRSVSYDIVPVKVYNSLVAGSDNLEVDATQISGDATAADNLEAAHDGTGYAGGTIKPKVDVDTIKTQAVTCAAGVTVLASVGTAATSTAQTGDAYGIVNSGTHGNAALKTLIDTIDDFLDTEIAAILADTNELQTDLTNGGRLDLLIDAIKGVTDKIDTALVVDGAVYKFTGNALEEAPTTATAAAVLAGIVEGAITIQQAMATMLAVLAGKSTGGRTTTIAFRNQADNTDRVSATMDADQNRDAVVLDFSDL